MQPNESVQPEIPAPPPLLESDFEQPVREHLWPAVAIWKHPLVILALIVTVGLTFSNSFQSGMTLDNKYIIEEYYKAITKMNAVPDSTGYADWNLKSWDQVGLLFTNDYWWPKGISGLYRPITSLTYWLDYVVLTGKAPRYDSVTGKQIDNATGQGVSNDKQGKPLSQVGWKDYAWAAGQLDMTSYHIINMLIHWINAILIYFVSLSMFKRVLPSAFVALLFAAHPITTETVTNVIGRADMFAATAVFGGLLLHMRASRNMDAWGTPWLIGLALLTAFGVFSKESAAAMVLVIIVYDITFRWRKDNKELSGLPWLILHGVAYLALVAGLIGLPGLVGIFAKMNSIPQALPLIVRIIIVVVSMGMGIGLYAFMFNRDRTNRILSLLAIICATLLSSFLIPFYPIVVALAVVVAELARASLTSDNPRYRVLTHAIFYLALYFGLIGLPIVALWAFQHAGWHPDKNVYKIFSPDSIIIGIFKHGGWSEWLPSWVRYPLSALLLGLGLFAHFATVGQDKVVRLLALIAVAVLAVIASFFSYWVGILLGLTVAMHELMLGSLAPQDSDYRRDWRLIFNGFSASYLAMIPALLAMFMVRTWLFSTTTPPEEPFLDNPIRGIWKVAELNMPSFEQELQQKPMLGMSFAECKMTAVKVMGKLLYLLTWPQTLCSDYSFDEFPNFSYTFAHGWEDWKAVLSLLWMILFFIVVPIFSYKRNKPLFFMVMFFFVAALPTSNLTITIGSVMAERFMYLPLAGFTGAVVIGMFWLARKAWTWLKLIDDESNFSWPSALAGTGLALVVCIYGVRAYYRNFVWTSDLTLWNDAIQTSTRSFRCYQSLAFALYEQDMGRNVDKMIALDEQGIRLVDGLPNHLNSSRMYLHLGMYYTIKGQQLCQQTPNGVITTPQAMSWFQKSAQILERGVQVDRAFNELNRTKQILRGDELERLNDVGLTPLYGSLGEVYIRMGQFDLADRRLTYQRHMDPFEQSTYASLAISMRQREMYQEAAVTLIQSIFLDQSNVRVWGELKDIYENHLADKGGKLAVVSEGNQIRLDANVPLVREHLKRAYVELIRNFRRAHRFDFAKLIFDRATAEQGYHFDRALFEPIFKEPIEIVTPDGLQAGQVDPLFVNYVDKSLSLPALPIR